MKKKQIAFVGETVYFSDTAVVELYERDGNRAKQIGQSAVVRADQPGVDTAEFKTSGAYYELFYDVT